MKAVPLAGDLGLGKTFIRRAGTFHLSKAFGLFDAGRHEADEAAHRNAVKKKAGNQHKVRPRRNPRDRILCSRRFSLLTEGKHHECDLPATLEALSLLREAGLLDTRDDGKAA